MSDEVIIKDGRKSYRRRDGKILTIPLLHVATLLGIWYDCEYQNFYNRFGRVDDKIKTEADIVAVIK